MDLEKLLEAFRIDETKKELKRAGEIVETEGSGPIFVPGGSTPGAELLIAIGAKVTN